MSERRRGLLRPTPWTGRPAVWWAPDHYRWCLEHLDVAPFDRAGLAHVDAEWVSVALGLAEPYLVNSLDEVAYAPGLNEGQRKRRRDD